MQWWPINKKGKKILYNRVLKFIVCFTWNIMHNVPSICAKNLRFLLLIRYLHLWLLIWWIWRRTSRILSVTDSSNEPLLLIGPIFHYSRDNAPYSSVFEHWINLKKNVDYQSNCWRASSYYEEYSKAARAKARIFFFSVVWALLCCNKSFL